MKHLSEQSVKQFESEGYLFPVTVLDQAETTELRSKLESFEATLGHPVKGPLRTKPHLMFKWVDDLIRHNTILDCVEDLIGPDILCWNTWFWIKEPNTKNYVSWHQDSQYWGLDTQKLVTAWIALSPASEESGCMRVMPKTHLGAPLAHEDLYHKDNLLTRGQEILHMDESKAVSMPLKIGEMSLHNVAIAHASSRNKTQDRRIGLSIHYMPTNSRQLNAKWDSATLVRGEDRFQHFESSPRPQYDLDPVSMAYHKKATDAMRDILFQGAEKVRPTI